MVRVWIILFAALLSPFITRAQQAVSADTISIQAFIDYKKKGVFKGRDLVIGVTFTHERKKKYTQLRLSEHHKPFFRTTGGKILIGVVGGFLLRHTIKD